MIHADLLLLDVRSVAVLLFFGNLLSSILGLMYLTHYRKDPANVRFLISKGLQAVSWAFFTARGVIPDFVSILLANLLLFLSLYLESSAFLLLRGLYQKWIPAAYIAYLFVFSGVFLIITSLGIAGNLRIAYVSIGTIGFYILTAILLFREPDRTLLQKSICYLYFFAFAVMTLRAFVSFSRVNFDFVSSNPVQSLSYLTFYIVMFLGTFGYILLAKEKVDRELFRAATLDPLTGLYNRRAFMDLAQKALSLAGRQKEPISLLTADLDHFKQINDMFGHYAGDAALKEFACVLRSQLRAYDLYARFGGEEFVVLLPNTDRGGAFGIAERIRLLTEACRMPSIPDLKFTVSIGVKCRGPEEGLGLEELIKRSDEALYMAKTGGRNRVFMRD